MVDIREAKLLLHLLYLIRFIYLVSLREPSGFAPKFGPGFF